MASRSAALYPLQFRPILKRLIWGGRRLHSLFNKPLGSELDYAESWEISDHREDVSIVASGPLEGESLRNLIAGRGAELLGGGARTTSQFPLLVKFLDAHQVLSVQVHPDDDLARRLVNDNGKNEAWVIVHAEPGSLIYAGLRRSVTKRMFEEALAAEEVEPLLHRFEPKVGDCIMIPAGTVHAIGAGVVLAEIQQMSDATFRVHDWGRLGADGRPRKLHLEEAIASTNFDSGPVMPITATPEPIPGGFLERLARCPYFAIDRLTLSGPATVGSRERFTILIALEGDLVIEHGGTEYLLAFGHTRLLPAAAGGCSVRPAGASAIAIECRTD